MKRFILAIISIIYLLPFQPVAWAASSSAKGDSTVYDSIEKGGNSAKTSQEKAADNESGPSLFPLFIKFVFAFILVIVLLIVLLRFLSKRNDDLKSNGPIIHLGGQSLGNNRSLQIVLIGQTIYIIGVGDTVNVLRTISQGEEYQHILANIETQADVSTPIWAIKDPKSSWSETLLKQLKKIKQENGEE